MATLLKLKFSGFQGFNVLRRILRQPLRLIPARIETLKL
jgi:hypothetical protein